jgi:hypothetical protein
LRIKDGEIEDSIHILLELSSKNARRKQVEASETRKFTSFQDATRNHFRLPINQRWIQYSII